MAWHLTTFLKERPSTKWSNMLTWRDHEDLLALFVKRFFLHLVICKDICVHILERSHSLVLFVGRDLHKRAAWNDTMINTMADLIGGYIHLKVSCVWKFDERIWIECRTILFLKIYNEKCFRLETRTSIFRICYNKHCYYIYV